jgi:hypothetical protein
MGISRAERRKVMRFKIVRFSLAVISLMGVFIMLSHVQAVAENPCATIGQCIAEADATVASAQQLYNGLQQALTNAQNAGESTAVRLLTTALRRAEVRLEQAQSAAQRAKEATTVEVASAEAGQVKNALAKIQGFIQDLAKTAAAPYLAPDRMGK